jgi:apolipoprotein N-acyltransferase
VSEVSVSRVRPGSPTNAALCRLAFELAALSGWRRLGLAFLLGLVAVAALPPVDMTPLLVVAFTGLLWLEQGSAGPRASFGLGYAFGFGFFLGGLYWIVGALFVDFASFWWLIPIAAVGLPAALAIYTGLVLFAVNIAGRYLRLQLMPRIFAFALAWTGAEWVRGHAFTGFPWNLIGSTWAGGFPGAIAMLQTVAWVGIYGLSFVTVLAASMPALLGEIFPGAFSPPRRWGPVLAATLLITFLGAAGAARLEMRPSMVTGTWLRIVQPAIPQTMKWDPSAAEANFQRLVDLSDAPARNPITAIIWPEAATPFLLERDASHRQRIAAIAPKSGYVVSGALRANPPPGPIAHIWNSMEAFDAKGDIVAHYDKTHLVPFGEYVPLRELLPIRKITVGSIDFSAGTGPRTITLPGIPPFAPLICYEAIFPGAVVDEGARPAWLLNLTNDAWYGRTSGPFQHLASARTRTVEEGLPMVRVANNGISAVIDSVGRVRARIDLDTIGYADVNLPRAGDPTFYSQAGDWSLLLLLLLGAIPVALRLR